MRKAERGGKGITGRETGRCKGRREQGMGRGSEERWGDGLGRVHISQVLRQWLKGHIPNTGLLEEVTSGKSLNSAKPQFPLG